MASTDPSTGEPQAINKDYLEIIKSEVEINKKFINEEGIPTKINYYCRDCKKEIQPKKVNKKFKFSCSECKGKNVSFGSEKSIGNYYKDAHKK